MKKNILALLASLLVPAFAFGQALPIRNDTPTTLRDLGSNLNVGRNFAVDQYGRTLVIVPAGTGGTYAEDSASTAGEQLTVIGAVRQDSITGDTSDDGDHSWLKTNSVGRLYTSTTVDAALPAGTNNIGDVDVLSVVPGSAATNLGKASGGQWTVADVGVGAWGVRNDSGTTLMADNNDYGPLGLTAQGWVRANVTGQDQPASATGLMKTEDAAAGNGDMAPAVQSVRQDTLASSVDTDGDFGYQKMDALGAQWVRERHAATGATTSVNDTASSTTCLAANAARNLATLYNDSTVSAYIKFGATASTTSFATIIPAQGLYEVPKQYSGIIDCIWASDASGAMRVTEVTY